MILRLSRAKQHPIGGASCGTAQAVGGGRGAWLSSFGPRESLEQLLHGQLCALNANQMFATQVGDSDDNDSKESFVYVLKHTTLPWFKIGKADSVQERARLVGLWSVDPAKSRVLQLATSKHAHNLERCLHRLLFNFRLSARMVAESTGVLDGAGEWFAESALTPLECLLPQLQTLLEFREVSLHEHAPKLVPKPGARVAIVKGKPFKWPTSAEKLWFQRFYRGISLFTEFAALADEELGTLRCVGRFPLSTWDAGKRPVRGRHARIRRVNDELFVWFELDMPDARVWPPYKALLDQCASYESLRWIAEEKGSHPHQFENVRRRELSRAKAEQELESTTYV